MCGLVAVVAPGPLSLEVVDRMRDRVAHRGPDGYASWIGATETGSVGLGHRRLAIIDLRETANQPMFSADGAYAIVYNGEIYNFAELREQLVQHGVIFRTACDTEVLLQAYIVWGTDCLPRLNGMFAFAIWDNRAKRLFVVRDRFGEKPLFYAFLPRGGIAFASEIKALFAHPDLNPIIDYERLNAFAAGAPVDLGEDTFFEGIHRVPAATAMTINERGDIDERWRYWNPNFDVRHPYKRREAIEQFRALLEKSVRLRLRSDVPLGACLSGGLDSSALVGMVAKVHGDNRYPGKTFSIRFDDDPDISEGHFIDRMNRDFGSDPYGITVDPKRLAEESRLLHWHHEEPFVSPSTYLEWCLMRLARENNDIVLLNGQGADELLGGYLYYFQLAQFDSLKQRRFLRAAKESLLWGARMHSESKKYMIASRRFGFDTAEFLQWAWGQWLDGIEPADVWQPGLPSSQGGGTFRHMIAAGLQYSVLPEQLHSADRNAMAFGVEARFPFLDYEFVDWCIGLPDQAMINNGWHKYILRSAMKGYIAPEIQWRVDKVGFAAPFDRWMRGPLHDWCRERLFEGPATELATYDENEIARKWDDHQNGRADRHWELWRWIGLNEWLSLSSTGAWKERAPQPASTDGPRVVTTSLA